VRCQGLEKRFGGIRAVDGVSLTLSKGVFSLLIGPNGSGKSTLINLLAGYYTPDDGRIYMDGRDITGLPPHKRFSLGIVRTFQTARVFPSMSVLDNILMAAGATSGERISLAPIKRRWLREELDLVERAFQILEIVGLNRAAHQPAGSLSGGQMKLLELGRVVMSGAKVLLMDEPTAGLNPVIAKSVLEHVKKAVTELKLAALLVEHRLDLAVRYADRVLAMFNGRLLAEGPPDHVLSIPDVVESYLGERLD